MVEVKCKKCSKVLANMTEELYDYSIENIYICKHRQFCEVQKQENEYIEKVRDDLNTGDLIKIDDKIYWVDDVDFYDEGDIKQLFLIYNSDKLGIRIEVTLDFKYEKINCNKITYEEFKKHYNEIQWFYSTSQEDKVLLFTENNNKFRTSTPSWDIGKHYIIEPEETYEIGDWIKSITKDDDVKIWRIRFSADINFVFNGFYKSSEKWIPEEDEVIWCRYKSNDPYLGKYQNICSHDAVKYNVIPLSIYESEGNNPICVDQIEPFIDNRIPFQKEK